MKIKEHPEDFIVSENISVKPSDKGDYILCRIVRKNMDHFSMLSSLSSYYRVSEKNIGIAGIKDKKAVITQYISLPGALSGAISQDTKVLLDGHSFLSIEYIGRIERHLNIGALHHNDFDIIVRDIGDDEKKRMLNKLSNDNNHVIPNYYGMQRFGNNYDNAKIGYYIIRKDFGKAASLLGLVQSSNPLDGIRRLPRRLRILMVSSLQSAIFNSTIITMLKGTEHNNAINDINSLIEYADKRIYLYDYNEKNDTSIPLPGLGMEHNSIVMDIMESLGINERDFAIRQMPDILLSPAKRKAFYTTDISFKWVDDNTMRLLFSLPRGSYATILLEYLCS